MQAAGIESLRRESPRYPARLRVLERPPAELWTIGDLALADSPLTASIVGTRRSTAYGERVTTQIAGALARAGVVIVSGMALGIDAAAHRAALAAGGGTIAVLGTGVNVPYPVSHRALHREICERGLALSEAPPGARAHPGSFPERNRLIAALGDVIIVVEAGFGSGTRHTVDFGVAIGRTIAAVPGPIDSPQSAASNALLREDAMAITCVADALSLFGLSSPVPATTRLDTEAEARVWKALDEGAASMDELCAATRLPASECLGAVTALELRGSVECGMTGEIRRR